jgi:hypothetical protein
MEPPLQIVKGEDGILRDVHNRPMIVVFNATRGGLRGVNGSGISPIASASLESSPFVFVNADGLTKEDGAARALIRTHVMRDHFRRKREKANQKRHSGHLEAKHSKKPIQVSVTWAGDPFGTCLLPPQPSGSLDHFSQYPIEMTTRTHQLVNHCKCANYREFLESSTDSTDVNIIAGLAQPGAFNYMASFAAGLRDQALFHVLLLTSALHWCYLTGDVNKDETRKGASTEIIVHKLAAIRKINEKLQDPLVNIPDNIIHAVTFLAMAEVKSLNT